MRKPRNYNNKTLAIVLVIACAVVIVGVITTLLLIKRNDTSAINADNTTVTQKSTEKVFEKESVPTTETKDATQETTTVKANETTEQKGSETLSQDNYTKYQTGEEIPLNMQWKYADFSAIHSGNAVYYKATENAKGIAIAVNAGHGTSGGESQKTYCHPDKSPKVTGGSTAQGSVMATAVAGGMSFNDGTKESTAALNMARILRDKLLSFGYDVVMLRDGEDVQLDNVARTVIANNTAVCHISIHFDGDGLDYDKGVFYIGVPDGIKNLESVASVWQKSENLGMSIVDALSNGGYKSYNNGRMEIDLTQTSYSTIPSVDLELGNQCSDISSDNMLKMADRIVEGINNNIG